MVLMLQVDVSWTVSEILQHFMPFYRRIIRLAVPMDNGQQWNQEM
jgi:hypothetical protein